MPVAPGRRCQSMRAIAGLYLLEEGPKLNIKAGGVICELLYYDHFAYLVL
ncbi:MAG: hypothetical protein WA667_15560 [Candidatus Nitrosopolaris sp.]